MIQKAFRIYEPSCLKGMGRSQAIRHIQDRRIKYVDQAVALIELTQAAAQNPPEESTERVRREIFDRFAADMAILFAEITPDNIQLLPDLSGFSWLNIVRKSDVGLDGINDSLFILEKNLEDILDSFAVKAGCLLQLSPRLYYLNQRDKLAHRSLEAWTHEFPDEAGEYFHRIFFAHLEAGIHIIVSAPLDRTMPIENDLRVLKKYADGINRALIKIEGEAPSNQPADLTLVSQGGSSTDIDGKRDWEIFNDEIKNLAAQGRTKKVIKALEESRRQYLQEIVRPEMAEFEWDTGEDRAILLRRLNILIQKHMDVLFSMLDTEGKPYLLSKAGFSGLVTPQANFIDHISVLERKIRQFLTEPWPHLPRPFCLSYIGNVGLYYNSPGRLWGEKLKETEWAGTLYLEPHQMHSDFENQQLYIVPLLMREKSYSDQASYIAIVVPRDRFTRELVRQTMKSDLKILAIYQEIIQPLNLRIFTS